MPNPPLAGLPAPKGRDPIRLALIGLDHLSSVRYVHATAFRSLIAPCLEPEQASAWLHAFYSSAYTERLVATALMGAWVDRELVGTAGWSPSPDTASSARIGDLYVLPMFGGHGIGTRLLAATEKSARQSGYATVRATVPLVSEGFFAAQGYVREPASVPVHPPALIPVATMRKHLL